MDHTAAFYSRPTQEFRGGAGFHVFSGARRQRGGGIFGAIKNFFLPVAKSVGRNAFSHGVGLANDVARDVMLGKNIKDSLLTHSKSRAVDLGKTAAREGLSSLTNMIGKGRRRAKRRITRSLVKRKRKSKSVKRRHASRKAPLRKRRARSHSTHRRKAKRRRTTVNF